MTELGNQLSLEAKSIQEMTSEFWLRCWSLVEPFREKGNQDKENAFLTPSIHINHLFELSSVTCTWGRSRPNFWGPSLLLSPQDLPLHPPECQESREFWRILIEEYLKSKCMGASCHNKGHRTLSTKSGWPLKAEGTNTCSAQLQPRPHGPASFLTTQSPP